MTDPLSPEEEAEVRDIVARGAVANRWNGNFIAAALLATVDRERAAQELPSVDDLAAALHEMEGPGRHSRPRLTRQICPGPDYHRKDAEKVIAALATTPPTPAEPPPCNCYNLALPAGIGHAADCPVFLADDRAEARPPEGLDALTERLFEALMDVDQTRPGGAYPHLGRALDVRRLAADLAARL